MKDIPKYLPYGSNEALDKLVNDKDYQTRLIAVDLGYGFDKLKYDRSKKVRLAIAKQGKEIDTFLEDYDFDVFDVAFSYVFKNIDDYTNDKIINILEYNLDHIIYALNLHPEWDKNIALIGATYEHHFFVGANIKGIFTVSDIKYIGALMILIHKSSARQIYTRVHSYVIKNLIKKIRGF